VPQAVESPTSVSSNSPDDSSFKKGSEAVDEWRERLFDSYLSTTQGAGGETGRGGPDFHSFLKTLPKRRGASIVDLGCGSGELISRIKQLGYTNVVGVDVSREQVHLAHERGIHEVRLSDIEGYLRDKEGQLDHVFLIDTLEHIAKSDVLRVLDAVSSALASDGVAVIQVPNGEGLFGMRVRYGDFTHETAFTPRSIRQVLLASGFRHVHVSEIRPVVHGVKSLVRRMTWEVFTLFPRALMIAETGMTHFVLSQNILVIAKK
jgi:2-polyprenyl-3-methyl-5-hydroxy-6-metoxy-1,4-benzoquinol methylase